MQFKMVASSRTLEITVISGEDMYFGRNLLTKDAYVVVRAESLNCCTTKMAKEGETNLSWNEKLFLNIPMHARSVTFEVHCKTSNGIIKRIGVARIALSEICGGLVGSGNPQVFNYRLRDWEGQRNGIINFSVRMKTPEECPTKKPAKEPVVVKSCGFQNEVMAFQVGEKNSNGVVTGIPIWWKYPSNI